MNGGYEAKWPHGNRDSLDSFDAVTREAMGARMGGTAEAKSSFNGVPAAPGTPGAFPPSLSALIREGAALKAEIDARTARLRRINLALSECAQFKDGQKTAVLLGAGYKVKVRLNEIVSWDQEKILKFREYLPEEKFAQLFKKVFEPTSKKEIDGFIAHADENLANGLKWCMSVKPGAPQVSYEKEGGCAARQG